MNLSTPSQNPTKNDYKGVKRGVNHEVFEERRSWQMKMLTHFWKIGRGDGVVTHTVVWGRLRSDTSCSWFRREAGHTAGERED
jgi:hypothetical protein